MNEERAYHPSDTHKLNLEYQGVRAAFVQQEDAARLDTAWEFLLQHSKDRTSDTGEDLLTHTLAVARIVTHEMGLGLHSVNAALLHEFLATDIPLSALRDQATPEAFGILQGLKKIKAIRTDRTRFQSENFIKLLLLIPDDIRAPLVRLADRLHHLRRYDQLKEIKRQQIAVECAYLYAPVAHRLGLYKIKTELEDLAMRILEPDAYQVVERKISDSEAKRETFIREFVLPITERLRRENIRHEVKWRTKSIPSIWGKMKAQGVDYEEVFDVFAIRIILDSSTESEKADCWKVYSLVTDIYAPNPDRLRDWISVPRASGYESLHTTVLGPGKRWVEIQIRSRRMDEVAEKGHAAHWQYKDSKADRSTAEWLRSIRELLENPSPDAFQDASIARTALAEQPIFVFTPEGDLRKLSAGATVLDFAFDIHSSLGASCVGARVNGRNVTIRQRLQNGDHVEIITSKSQRPKPDWLGFVVSSKARTRIRRALKEAEHRDAAMGREILERKFRNWKVVFNDENVARIIKKFRFKDSVELYASIAGERIDLKEIKELLTSDSTKAAPQTPAAPGQQKESQQGKQKQTPDVLEIDQSLQRTNVEYSLGKCCNPIFGDPVFGFVTVSKGITIHRVNCPNASGMIARYPYRVIRVKWKETSEANSYLATIRISGEDKLGIVSAITEIISKDMKVNMRSITFDSSGGRFEGLLVVQVVDTQHLDALLHRLQKIEGVNRAIRAD